MNNTTQITASTAARMPEFTVGAPSSRAAYRPTGYGYDVSRTTNLPAVGDGDARGEVAPRGQRCDAGRGVGRAIRPAPVDRSDISGPWGEFAGRQSRRRRGHERPVG